LAIKKIVVTPETLKSTATQIDSLRQTYQSQYSQLRSTVESTKNAWKAKDNTAFCTQIQGYYNDFDKMLSALLEYSNYLKNAATEYTNNETKVAAEAKKLSLGN